MELIGGLVIAAILVIAGVIGWWAKTHPSETYDSKSETGVSDREWMDAIR